MGWLGLHSNLTDQLDLLILNHDGHRGRRRVRDSQWYARTWGWVPLNIPGYCGKKSESLGAQVTPLYGLAEGGRPTTYYGHK